MKKLIPFVCFALFFISTVSIAQKSVKLEPYTFNHAVELTDADIAVANMPALDMERIALENEQDELNGKLRKIGKNHQVNLNLDNSGTWEYLPNGDRLWRLRIESNDALAIILYYNSFYLPDGATMHVYNEDRSMTIGAFTSINNADHGLFATELVTGDVSIVEYYEPFEVAGEGIINISEVGHAYRDIQPMTEVANNERGGDPCEVDVICSEGDNWRDQIDGVVKISVKDGANFGWCSGSVVNNTNLDCKPYVLTAYHCGIGVSSSDHNQWVYYFKNQGIICGGLPAQASVTETGGTMRANSNDNGGNNGSDFLLVELNNDIAWAANAYYNGWDATNSNVPNGVSVHHPSGGKKSISTFTNSLLTSGWGVANTHWRVSWVATANGHGVTEGGSSGSPIFNGNNGLIVGQLTGGGSFCTSPNSPDFYGKMSWNWTNNPNSSGQKLKVWLDPANTGATTLNGMRPPCATAVEDQLSEEYLINVYPNPSTGQVTVELDRIKSARVEVYDALGAKITSIRNDGVSKMNLDLSGHADGIYYVNVYVEDKVITKRVAIMR